MVLLKNENSALPLAKNSKVSLYSANSVTFVYAGSGSSSNLPANVAKHAVSLKDGLTSAGLTVNESLWNWYSNHTEYWQGDITTDGDGNKISTVSGNRQQTAAFLHERRALGGLTRKRKGKRGSGYSRCFEKRRRKRGFL